MDAIYQTEALVLLPITMAASLLYLLFASLFPGSVGAINVRAVQIGGVIALGAAWFWLDTRLDKYAATHKLQTFDKPLDRMAIVLLYGIDAICIPVAAWAAYAIHGH